MPVQSGIRRSVGGRRLLAIGAMLILGLAGTAIWVWFGWLPHYRPSLHANERLGIDVSHHQGTIDWERVAGDGMSFAYIKASEGRDFQDPRFAQNWTGAGDAGLERGAYHFFSLCASGKEQARNFLQTSGGHSGELGPALDLELEGNCAARPDRASVLRELAAYLDAVETQALVPTTLYLGDDFEERYRITDSIERPLWVLRFLRRPDEAWRIWQVGGFSSIDGIPTRVDLDVMH